jgi:hypothetical protein
MVAFALASITAMETRSWDASGDSGSLLAAPCTIQRRTMEKKPKCRICDDTGFFKGAICVCISGKGDPNTDAIKDLFGDIFRDKSQAQSNDKF